MAGKFMNLKLGRTRSKAFFDSWLTINHTIGYDVNGLRILDNPDVRPARINEHLRTIVNTDGTDITSQMTIYVAGLLTLGPDDEIHLPDGRKPTVMRLRPHPSSGSVVYTEIVVE